MNIDICAQTLYFIILYKRLNINEMVMCLIVETWNNKTSNLLIGANQPVS